MPFTKYIPTYFKYKIRKILFTGTKYYCNVCNSHLRKFLPGGNTSPAVEKYYIIGAGFHKHDSCPVCKASYRLRLQMLYLQQMNEPKKGRKMLHIAPETSFHFIFSRRLKQSYICGDLEPERYRYYANPIRIDIIQIPFDDQTFDIIVCNHVLEHIPDDRKAMKELYRVLKPGGFALLQVPISWKLDQSYEDPSITKPEERLAQFGQKDHVRIYGKDYINRMEESGFTVDIVDSIEFKDIDRFYKMGLDIKERLFIGHR